MIRITKTKAGKWQNPKNAEIQDWLQMELKKIGISKSDVSYAEKVGKVYKNVRYFTSTYLILGNIYCNLCKKYPQANKSYLAHELSILVNDKSM